MNRNKCSRKLIGLIVLLAFAMVLMSAYTVGMSIEIFTPGNVSSTIDGNQNFTWFDVNVSLYKLEFASDSFFNNIVLTFKSNSSEYLVVDGLPRQKLFYRVLAYENGNLVGQSVAYSYDLSLRPTVGYIPNYDNYDDVNLVNFKLDDSFDAADKLVITNKEGFYLPVWKNTLVKKEFSIVLSPSIYVFTTNIKYRDYTSTQVDEFRVPRNNYVSVVSDSTVEQETAEDDRYTASFRISDGVKNLSYVDIKLIGANGNKFSVRTDGNGYAEFYGKKQCYNLEINYGRYIKFSKGFDLDEDINLNYILTFESKKPETKIIESTINKPVKKNFGINLIEPGANKIYSEDNIPVLFKTSNQSEIERCQVLIKKDGLSGYRIFHTFFDVEDENSFYGEIVGGNYAIKLRCLGNDDEYDVTNDIKFKVVDQSGFRKKIKSINDRSNDVLKTIDKLPQSLRQTSLISSIKSNINTEKKELSDLTDVVNELDTTFDSNVIEKKLLSMKGKNYVDQLKFEKKDTTIMYISHDDLALYKSILSINEDFIYLQDIDEDVLFAMQESFAIKIEEYDLVKIMASEKKEIFDVKSISMMPMVDEDVNLDDMRIFEIINENDRKNIYDENQCVIIENYCVIEHLAITEGVTLFKSFGNNVDSKFIVLPVKSIDPKEAGNIITGFAINTGEYKNNVSLVMLLIPFILIGILSFIFIPNYGIISMIDAHNTKNFTEIMHTVIDMIQNEKHHEVVSYGPIIIEKYQKLSDEKRKKTKDMLQYVNELLSISHMRIIEHNIRSNISSLDRNNLYIKDYLLRYGNIFNALSEINKKKHYAEYNKIINLCKGV